MLLVGLALFLGVTFGIEAVSRVVFASWSISLGGRDTLTGGWVGSLRARQGADYGLYINLEFKRRSFGYRGGGAISPSGSTNLEGHASLCTPAGERYDYNASGHADPTGGVTGLWLEYGDPKLSALNLRLSGVWQPPALNLATNTNPFLPDGRFLVGRTISSNDPDDTFVPFVLNKGESTAFETICRQIQY